MPDSKFKIQNWRYLFCILLFAFCLVSINAQSTSQDFPTPVTANEINGKISARDIGDPRATSYFYTFNGEQGDIFINVEAANLNGDVDVFTAGNLRPLTKITLYAGDTTIETGRVIYLRKPEKLILRVEGRTPNDNPATFRIKFAGSFVALQPSFESEEPKLPEVRPDDKSGIRVNSVGTIVEIKPKPTPERKQTVAETEKSDEKKESENKTVENPEKKSDENKSETKGEVAETEIEKTVKTTAKTTRKTTPRTTRTKTQPKKTTTETAENTNETNPAKVEKKTTSPGKRPTNNKPPKETAPDPLANLRLIILFKDGSRIERPMPEVLRFSVDKAILTVISKDGTIGRYSLIDVIKFSVE